ncbi:MAG: hypothetical protein AB1665_08760 [Candidatus Thermoplasmatota archaeon]
MNELSRSILNIMESTPLGKMSIYVLRKQSADAGIDLEMMCPGDLPALVEKFRVVLPFFLGEQSKRVVSEIKKLGVNGGD